MKKQQCTHTHTHQSFTGCFFAPVSLLIYSIIVITTLKQLHLTALLPPLPTLVEREVMAVP